MTTRTPDDDGNACYPIALIICALLCLATGVAAGFVIRGLV